MKRLIGLNLINRVFYFYMAGCVAYLLYTKQFGLAMIFMGAALYELGKGMSKDE